MLDPDGIPEHGLVGRRYRNLLLHYAPVFIAQGGVVRPFGERLRVLARASDTEFTHYLSEGDELLRNPTTRRARVGYSWRGVRYLGTFFRGFAWPDWLTAIEKPAKGGVFFWGIAQDIVVGLQNGTLSDFRFVVGEQAIVDRGESTMAIVMPDRTLLIWGLTMKDLEDAEDAATQESARKADGMNGNSEPIYRSK